MSNKVYDILKWIAQYLLPGLGTLYFAISQIWGLPYGEEVVGTITAVDAFLGMCLGISTSMYKKSENYGNGDLNFNETHEGVKPSFAFNEDPMNLINKKTVLFRVNDNTSRRKHTL